MSTVLDLIEGALRLIQVKSSDTALTSEEANDGLESLNAMLDSYVNAPFFLYKVTRETITLPSTATSYTWGVGAYDINSVPPNKILTLRSNTNLADIHQIDVDDFFTADYNTGFYYETTWPAGTLYYSGAVGETLVAVSYKPLATFTSLTETVNLPPGYYRAIKYNLALELAPEYQVDPQPDVRMIATEAMKLLKTRNIRLPTSRVDAALLSNYSNYNINADGY